MATVLVVDDESIVRDVVVRYLERDGYRTLEAPTGGSLAELPSSPTPLPAGAVASGIVVD